MKLVLIFTKIIAEIRAPGPDRIWYVADAFRQGLSVEEVFQYTSIDSWFLCQIQELVGVENTLRSRQLQELTESDIRFVKQKGFSDRRLATLLQCDPTSVTSSSSRIRYSSRL
jgi:carbamoyl-phosphate synthase large subunit